MCCMGMCMCTTVGMYRQTYGVVECWALFFRSKRNYPNCFAIRVLHGLLQYHHVTHHTQIKMLENFKYLTIPNSMEIFRAFLPALQHIFSKSNQSDVGVILALFLHACISISSLSSPNYYEVIIRSCMIRIHHISS